MKNRWKKKRSEEDKIENELTELQEKIAQITGSVDEKKNHIMEILNNRASTKAQIQKFDTMMEQIQVRKSQINREILANDSEIAEENESLNKFQMELKVISDKIISLNDENKKNMNAGSGNCRLRFRKNPRSCRSDNLLFTGNSPDWNH